MEQKHFGKGDNVSGDKNEIHNINKPQFTFSNSKDKDDGLLWMILLGIMFIGLVFVLCPGMVILFTIATLFDMNLSVSQMWIFSILLCFLMFFAINQKVKNFSKAGQTYLFIAFSISVFFIIANFGFHASFPKNALQHFFSNGENLEVWGVNTSYNRTKNGKNGMEASFNVCSRGLKNIECSAYVYIYDKNKRENIKMAGNESPFVNFIPQERFEAGIPLTIFIPNDKINVKKGKKHDLFYQIFVYSKAEDGWVNHGTSTDQNFWIEK